MYVIYLYTQVYIDKLKRKICQRKDFPFKLTKKEQNDGDPNSVQPSTA